MQHVRNGMVGTEELEANYSESACSSTEEKRVTDRGEIDSVPHGARVMPRKPGFCVKPHTEPWKWGNYIKFAQISGAKDI
jgi:hypothetical protein